MNVCGLIFSVVLMSAVVSEEPTLTDTVTMEETSMGITDEWRALFNSQTREVGILTGELKSLRDRIREHDGLIIQINRNLLGVQNNIGQQIQEACPFMQNRNYVDIVLGGLALVGVIGIYNWGSGLLKKGKKNASVPV